MSKVSSTKIFDITCCGTTNKNLRCKNKVLIDKKYCYIHQKQECEDNNITESTESTNISGSADKQLNIKFEDINDFNNKKKSKNDKNNKLREKIIYHIISDNIPHKWYIISNEWSNLKNEIFKAINYICEIKDIKNYNKIEIKLKAGLNNYHDFDLIIDNNIIKLEFKYNKLPQFVSPGKPSQFIKCKLSYEEFYYDNFFTKVCKIFHLPIPPKDIYLKEVGRQKPTCLTEHQIKYKK